MALIFLNNKIYSAGVFVGSSDNACCPMALGLSGSGPDAAYTAIDREVRQLCLTAAVTLHISWDFFGLLADHLQVLADGVVKYDTLCATGAGSGTAVIPAGTSIVSIQLAGSCNAPQGATDLWSVTITC